MRSILIALALSIPFFAHGASLEAELASFEEFVRETMEADRMPGISIAVLRGEELWARGFGHADLENHVPAKPESSYRMASVTKPMTAVAALRLAESGRLDLDAPIRTWVPYFPDKGSTITIRQLLAHLGGISHYRNYSVEGFIREPKTTRESIAIFQDFELVAEPGSRYSYSTYGYNLVGAALEAVTGKPYGELMQELVWGPAGMKNTRMDDPTAIIPNRVRGYQLDGDELRNSTWVNISSRFAGGGTRGTVIDMVRFADAVDEGRLLGDSMVDLMWWPSTTSGGRWVTYGLGWGVSSLNGHFHVNHGGSQQETRTLLLHVPSLDLSIAFASNFEDARLNAYRDRLWWELTGEAWNPEVHVPDRADRLARDAAENAFDTGMMQYDRTGRPATTDRGELAAAFRAFNQAVAAIDRSPESAEKAIGEGTHPAAGQPALKVGSYLASRLLGRAGADASRYHRGGELPFIRDYIRLYRSDRSIPRAYRFERRFERRIEELASAWERVWTPEAEEILASGTTDPARIRSLLESAGARPRALPDLTGRLVVGVETAFQRGDAAGTLELARFAAEAYPEHSESTGVYGVTLTIIGERAEGLSYLRKSASIRANGYASGGSLRGIARYLAGQKMVSQAIALLENAAAVHPEDSAVQEALARTLAEGGEPVRARAAWERLLALDPDSKAAKEALGSTL
ncbi:MAG TPA: serine hydrolase [Thermoanaerobaculia bacterium]|nr:serine hydrolase [Thermoanaerobaculia bacterium]